jgi:hypothetical protein
MARFRKYATPEMKPRYYGMMQTTWSSPERFMNGFYGIKTNDARPNDNQDDPAMNPWDTFRTMYKKIDELSKEMK